MQMDIQACIGELQSLVRELTERILILEGRVAELKTPELDDKPPSTKPIRYAP